MTEPQTSWLPADIDATVQAHGARRTTLVQILREVQAPIGWLPRPALRQVAAAVGLTPAIVEGVAGSYRFFRLKPVGRVHLLFSDNVTDRMLGSRSLAAQLCGRLGLRPGEMAADRSVSVGFTSCTGLGFADRALAALRHHPLGRDAVRMGRVVDDPHGFVQMQTRLGSLRLVEWPAGESLPRSC